MTKRKVFFSFNYKDDNWRVQQIKNIGAIEGQTILNSNQWEEVKARGDTAIKNWIDNSMSGRSCVVVLIGSNTAERKWVKYEINKALEDRKGLFGINIHNLEDRYGARSIQGENPFKNYRGFKVYNPPANTPYIHIRDNIEDWIEQSLERARNRT